MLKWSDFELMRPKHTWKERSGKHVIRGFRLQGYGEVFGGLILFVAGVMCSWTPSLNTVTVLLLVCGALAVTDGFSLLTEKVVIDEKQLKSVRLFRARSAPVDGIRAIDLDLGMRRGQKVWLPVAILDDGTRLLLGAMSSPQKLESSRSNVYEVVRTLRALVGVGGRAVA